ncbi:MAG: hypothetical protein ACQRW7_10675 [Caulobacterales bacterium]|uniref:hypothetical protein n=1 Tax=Glycocaulis sp. TaxID=1969725 RepID=UPI003FA04ADC
MTDRKPRPVPTPKPVPPSQRRPKKPHSEDTLDEALEESFPASDPPAPASPEKRKAADKR